MRKVWVIAAREYKAAVKTKSFLIGIILLPIMMGGGFLAQMLFKNQVDLRPKHFAIVDRTPGQQARGGGRGCPSLAATNIHPQRLVETSARVGRQAQAVLRRMQGPTAARCRRPSCSSRNPIRRACCRSASSGRHRGMSSRSRDPRLPPSASRRCR